MTAITRYTVTDGNADLAIDAESPQDAAQQYVDGGDWGAETRTTWITCYVTPLDADDEPLEREQITITVDPPAPRCTAEAHDWQSPHAVVGGLVENPGVHGHGGGVIIHEVCGHCGTHRRTDTWAQNPATGEQGLESVAYTDADAAAGDQ